MNNNDAIIARIKGVPARLGTAESDADPLNPNALRQDNDDLECAYVRLKGAAQRLMMILDHRSERNYDLAVAAVANAHAEYLRSRTVLGQRTARFMFRLKVACVE